MGIVVLRHTIILKRASSAHALRKKIKHINWNFII